MKISIIGAGNMGGATAIGLLNYGSVNAEDLTLTAGHLSSLERFTSMGIRTLVDNAEAARDADVIILAVKPWVIPAVCREIAHVLDFSTQQIISMAPGVAPEDLIAFLSGSEEQDGDSKSGHNQTPALTYVIPNTAIEVGESMTFVAGITSSEAQIEEIAGLFAGCGSVMVIPRSQLSACTALASCGIAYAFRYIRASAEGGVELGLYAKDATKIVAQTVKGAAALLEAHGTHPEQEIDKVTTPGGLTIRGLNAMEEAGFTNAVIKGLKGGR